MQLLLVNSWNGIGGVGAELGGVAFWLWAFAAMFVNNCKMAPRIRYSRTTNSAHTFAAFVAGRLLHFRLQKLSRLRAVVLPLFLVSGLLSPSFNLTKHRI